MSTLPRLRLLAQHCRWRRSTSWGKRMGGTTGQVHATEAKNQIGACLAFLAQLCLGFHLIFAKEHIGSLFLSCFVF